MGIYRFGKWNTWDSYTSFVIEKKGFFGWSEVKSWGLGWEIPYKEYSKEFEDKQRKLMMESVDRLVKAGNTVI